MQEHRSSKSQTRLQIKKVGVGLSPRRSFSRLGRWLINPAAEGDSLSSDTARSRAALRIGLISIAIFIAWAAFAELDQVTRAPATVISSSRSQVMQAVDGGVLQALHVKEGDIVESGQVLAKLDKRKLEASYLEAQAKAVALRMNVARLQAEVLDQPLNIPSELKKYPEFLRNQEALFSKRKSSIQEEIQALDNMYRLAMEELEISSSSIAKRYILSSA